MSTRDTIRTFGSAVSKMLSYLAGTILDGDISRFGCCLKGVWALCEEATKSLSEISGTTLVSSGEAQ